MAFLGTFAAMGKSTSRRSAKELFENFYRFVLCHSYWLVQRQMRKDRSLQRMSGSGAVAETVLCRDDAGKLPQTCGTMLHIPAQYSAQGGEGTFGSFRCFCLLLALLPKVGRVRRRETSPSAMGKSTSRSEPRNVPAPGRKPLYFSGAFFIFAQLRGNWGGVSLTLRITTSRWVTAVPGMA